MRLMSLTSCFLQQVAFMVLMIYRIHVIERLRQMRMSIPSARQKKPTRLLSTRSKIGQSDYYPVG